MEGQSVAVPASVSVSVTVSKAVVVRVIIEITVLVDPAAQVVGVPERVGFEVVVGGTDRELEVVIVGAAEDAELEDVVVSSTESVELDDVTGSSELVELVVTTAELELDVVLVEHAVYIVVVTYDVPKKVSRRAMLDGIAQRIQHILYS